jgi:GTP-binding protein EngB required for normal cell division
MNNLVDPVNILMVGSHGVGKTSLLKRLANKSYVSDDAPTTGLEVIDFRADLKHSASIRVSIIDVGASMLQSKQSESAFSQLFSTDIDGVCIVADGCKVQTILDVRYWLDLVAKQGVRSAVQHLIVNKADALPSELKFSPRKLSAIVRASPLDDWSWTVGNAEFGDFDVSRGSVEHQRAPEDVLRMMVLAILQKRQGNFCKLLPVPFELKYDNWTSYTVSEIEQFVRDRGSI